MPATQESPLFPGDAQNNGSRFHRGPRSWQMTRTLAGRPVEPEERRAVHAGRHRTPPGDNCTNPVNPMDSIFIASKTPENAKNIHAAKAGMSHRISKISQKWGLDRKPECPLKSIKRGLHLEHESCRFGRKYCSRVDNPGTNRAQHLRRGAIQLTPAGFCARFGVVRRARFRPPWHPQIRARCCVRSDQVVGYRASVRQQRMKIKSAEHRSLRPGENWRPGGVSRRSRP